ncbi:MAG: hypothetical protein EB075_13545 [Bacteroidetes bacterium]|nr:hypothetical protein [Bacteroidota bacterium]
MDVDPKTWRLNAFAEETEENANVTSPPVRAVDSGPAAAVDPSSVPSLQRPEYQRRYTRDYRSDDCPDGGCLSSVLHVEYSPQGAPATCASGSYYDVGAARCAPYRLRKDGDAFVRRDEQTISYATYGEAYDDLPQSVKDSALSPGAVAELANRVWRDAAVRPGFSGVPFSQAQPVMAEDVRFEDAGISFDWPQVSDLVEPLPTEDPMGLRTLNDSGETS